jgi:ATP-dependent Lon protease
MNPSFVTTTRVILPAVPLRDMVVFPHQIAPFIVGRESSVRALENALSLPGKKLFLVSQRDPKIDDPQRQDLQEIGVIARVIQSLRLPNGNVKVMVEGEARAKLLKLEENEGLLQAEVEEYVVAYPMTDTLQTYLGRVLSLFEQYAKMSHHLAFEGLMPSLKLDDPDRFADTLAANLTITTAEKQTLLETLNTYERLQRLHDLIDLEIEKLNIDKRINVQVKKQMERAQKEYYLNEKVKAIHDELGRKDDRADEIRELREKIEAAGMSAEAKQKAEQELKRLEMMPGISAEATVSRSYLDWLISVPWTKRSRELRDLKKAQEILDADHFGLRKIKERILEFLAVRSLTKKPQASIICFVGPPGVGKSSLAKSIAKATGRQFVRLSLGGVRDEAEIRGHRRTYIGAFPGQIIQMLKKAGTVNPVFLLDEVDKMAMDFRGDPAAALLEVLDPAQNDSFTDHYLDVAYDLSKVMFIATANVLHTVPPALRDRLEVIELSGYTSSEKLAIGRDFLVKRQLEAHGLDDKALKDRVRISPEAITALIDFYTREAGVRSLDREIASVCRKLARLYVEKGDDVDLKVEDLARIQELLGKARFRRRIKHEVSMVGISTGLAWTEVGGEILESQVGLMKGTGKLILTGKLGDVMQESARAATSYVRSRADLLGIDPEFNSKLDIHLHVPEGAIPKDGPSAGITMATALVSALTEIPVRKDVAMTGELTLRGRVLPIGGLKEKLLAAVRAGCKTVIIPHGNVSDLAEVPPHVKEKLEIIPARSMDDVLKVALVRSLPAGTAVVAPVVVPARDKAKPNGKNGSKPRVKTVAARSGKRPGPSIAARKRGRTAHA